MKRNQKQIKAISCNGEAALSGGCQCGESGAALFGIWRRVSAGNNGAACHQSGWLPWRKSWRSWRKAVSLAQWRRWRQLALKRAAIIAGCEMRNKAQRRSLSVSSAYEAASCRIWPRHLAGAIETTKKRRQLAPGGVTTAPRRICAYKPLSALALAPSARGATAAKKRRLRKPRLKAAALASSKIQSPVYQ
jgi:hypothetical protein